jgi:thiosulfate/3-mercaptopyruvate sulfurtransferase
MKKSRPPDGSRLPHTTLVTVRELAARLADPDWLVVDCRFDLADRDAGARAWRAGHIPGAIHADLERDLSAPVTPQTGRHPLPEIDTFVATLSRWGVTDNTQVAACDAGNSTYAARLWWMLRYLGHDAVAVLDGGYAAWLEEGQAVSNASAMRRPGRFVARPRPAMLCDATDVAGELARGELVVDVRGAERFAGKLEPLDTVAGHIPGAVNLPFQLNLDAKSRFRPKAEIAELWRARTGLTDGSRLTCMCGSGVTACQALLALEVAGRPGGRLYAGSWSEWIRDPTRPVAGPVD